jgi:hypothetical protein
MSNVGRWEGWHNGVTDPTPYGDTRSYRVGAEFLSDCALIEDWGCGQGGLRLCVPADRYRGVDGSTSHFADEIVDLCEYRSEAEAVFMRHVLEHNRGWRSIMENALTSAQRRCVIILFTPLADDEIEIGWNENIGVPDLSLPWPEFEARLPIDCQYTSWTVESDTQCNEETIVLISQPGVEHDEAAARARAAWGVE